MKDHLKTQVESLVEGLNIDGKVELSEVVAVFKKVVEVVTVASSDVKLDGKVETSEAIGVLKALIKVAPKEFREACFAALHDEIKASKTKLDDLFEPALTLLEKIIVRM